MTTSHPSHDDLVLHHYGEGEGASIEEHLAACEACRAEGEAIRRTLESLADDPVPERGEDYGARVWERIRPLLPPRRRVQVLRRLWVPAALAASLLVAFLLGRQTAPPAPKETAATPPVRERILLVALGEHMERSQMVLAELVNAPAERPTDVRSEQRFAEELIPENRLYRQALARSGESGLNDVLDDLERVLVEIANGPSELSARQLREIRERIESRGILFKVRVVGRQMKEKSRRVLAESRVDS
jgi:hypothetical protein